MNLLARIARLERAAPPRAGCGSCAGRGLWAEEDWETFPVVDGRKRCPQCGRDLTTNVKLLARELIEAL